MSDDERDSLFGSPPPSPVLAATATEKGRSSALKLALPRARTSADNDAASTSNSNVGTIAHSGLHSIFDTNTVSISSHTALPSDTSQHVTALSRPPALSRKRPRAGPAFTDTEARRALRNLLRDPKSTPRPLAQPLDFADAGDVPTTNLLRSHPSLLGKAGAVAKVQPKRQQPSSNGHTAHDPIIIEADPSTDSRPRPLFKPKFVGNYINPTRVSSSSLNPLQSPAISSRSILSNAILKQMVSDKDVADAKSPVIRVLRADPRFRTLVRDLGSFLQSVHRAQSVLPLATPSTRGAEESGSDGASASEPPAKKRRKSTSNPKSRNPHIPSGAEYWTVPFPFEKGKVPPSYHAEWQSTNAKRLLEDFVTLLRAAQRSVAKENLGRKMLRRRAASVVAPCQPPPPPQVACRTAVSPDPEYSPAPESMTAGTPPLDFDIDELITQIGTPSSDGADPPLALDDLWRILRDVTSSSANNCPSPSHTLTNSGSSEYAYSASAFSESELFAAMNTDGAAFPSAESETPTHITSALEQHTPQLITDDLLDPSLLFNSEYSPFDAFSSPETEEMDYMTGSMSPASTFGILPTPTTASGPASMSASAVASPKSAFTDLPMDMQIPDFSAGFDTGDLELEAIMQGLDLPPMDVHMNQPDFGFGTEQDTAIPSSLEALPPPPVASGRSHDLGAAQTTTPTEPLVKPVVLRKRNAVAKAKARREALIEEITRVQMQLWEYTIEAGVIQNIARV